MKLDFRLIPDIFCLNTYAPSYDMIPPLRQDTMALAFIDKYTLPPAGRAIFGALRKAAKDPLWEERNGRHLDASKRLEFRRRVSRGRFEEPKSAETTDQMENRLIVCL